MCAGNSETVKGRAGRTGETDEIFEVFDRCVCFSRVPRLARCSPPFRPTRCVGVGELLSEEARKHFRRLREALRTTGNEPRMRQAFIEIVIEAKKISHGLFDGGDLLGS